MLQGVLPTPASLLSWRGLAWRGLGPRPHCLEVLCAQVAATVQQQLLLRGIPRLACMHGAISIACSLCAVSCHYIAAAASEGHLQLSLHGSGHVNMIKLSVLICEDEPAS
jgi:hypothetical protein